MTPDRLEGSPPAAIVLGLDCITGLQTARILARRGVPIIGLARDPGHFCCRTRAAATVIEADPDAEGFPSLVEEIAARLGPVPVLVPCTDPAVLSLSRHRVRLGDRVRLALPAAEMLDTLVDKLRFHAFAESVGVPVPRTFPLESREQAETVARQIVYPAILKPSIRSALWDRHSPAKVHRVADGPELLELYERFSPWADALAVQEWIEGPDSELYSVNAYFDERSEPLVTFVARKLRQWPPRAGTSSLGEECRNDEALELSLRLLRASRFRGLGYVEVKRDVRTGRHAVLEVNVGRPTGRSAIAEAGGVELLYTMYCHLAGLPLPEAREQRYGSAKWIFWRQDARSAFHDWRRRELTLGEWARSWRGRKASAVFSWSDPAPFLADGRQLLARAVSARAVLPRSVSTRSAPEGASGPVDSRALVPARPSAPAALRLDYDLNGVLGVRLIDPAPGDRAAAERLLGPPGASLRREPDLTLRFVERLSLEGLRFVEVDRSGFTEEGFYVRPSPRGGWARVPFETLGRPSEILCERGTGSVALLKPALRLCALARGVLPLHASAFEWNGAAVVVTGWTHGGKTSALLAFGARGARYLGDDLVFLAPDGGKVFGMPSKLQLSDWHSSQLPDLPAMPRGRRLVLDALGRIEGWSQARGRVPGNGSARPGAQALSAGSAVVGRARRRLRVALPVETLFPAGTATAAVPQALFLMMSAREGSTVVEPIDPAEIAARMRHSQRFEELAFAKHYLAFRFAFPARRNPIVEEAESLETDLLRRVLPHMRSYRVTHPYPVPFDDLFAAMRPWCEPDAAAPAEPRRLALR